MRRISALVLVIGIAAVFLSAVFLVYSATGEGKEKQKKKGKIDFPARVTEMKEIDVKEVDGIVTRVFNATVETPKPKLEDLLQNEQEYFEWLEENMGEEGKKIIKQRTEELKKFLDEQPDTMITIVPVVKLEKPNEGKSIQFGWSLYDKPGGTSMDPVNLVFWYYSSAGNVYNALDRYLDYDWAPIGYPFEITLYAYIDKDHADGVGWTWVPQTYAGQMYIPVWPYRYHTRLFDGGYDYDVYKYWSIGGTHYERFWKPHQLEPNAWERAESFLKNDFADETWAEVSSVWLGNNYNYQGIWNDGWAAKIKIKAVLL